MFTDRAKIVLHHQTEEKVRLHSDMDVVVTKAEISRNTKFNHVKTGSHTVAQATNSQPPSTYT